VPKLLLSRGIVKLTGLLPILGFSDRLIGGGPGFCEVSRLCSPDLLGGGGEGGCEGGRDGDLPGSKRGVFGLLGILKCLGEDDPDVADIGASVDRYEEVFVKAKFSTVVLGGDCGGWIVTEGGTADISLGRRFRVGDGDRLPEPFTRGGRKPPVSTFPLSLPLPACPSPSTLFTLSDRLEMALAGSPFSRILILGFGEIGLGGAIVLFLGFEFAICSKCERREETGFCNPLSALFNSYSFYVERLTMDVSSRASSPGSSILSSTKNDIQL
jgi:hypothetical protein